VPACGQQFISLFIVNSADSCTMQADDVHLHLIAVQVAAVRNAHRMRNRSKYQCRYRMTVTSLPGFGSTIR
jgi:hypothetical protein